jgi:hypothetical protein
MEAQTKETTYNGWTNHETWLVNLWLNNDEGSYHELLEIVANAESLHDAAHRVSATVTERAENNMTEEASITNDLITSALGNVNWKEIVDALPTD